MASDNPFVAAVKWALFIINLISAVYALVILFQYLSHRDTTSTVSGVFVANCVIGFLVAWLGAYAAWNARQDLLVMYAVTLIICLILASVGRRDLVYPVNLGLYGVCILLAFVYAFLIRRGASVL